MSSVYKVDLKVGILTSWGKLRTWTCGGHFHEHPDLDLINILESLAGLPYEVEFLNFDEVTKNNLESIDVLINAGFAGSSWSGGEHWKDDKIVTMLTEWVHDGGIFMGVNEPSAVQGYANNLRMAPVLGIDVDDGRRLCHGFWKVEQEESQLKLDIRKKDGVYLIDGDTKVLQERDNLPVVTERSFGKGKGIYLSEYRYSPENTFALRSILEQGKLEESLFCTDNPLVDCAYFPEAKTLVLANGSREKQSVVVRIGKEFIPAEVEGFAIALISY